MGETRTALPEVVRFGFMAPLTETSARDCSNASEFVRRATLGKLRELPGSRNVAHRAAASAG